MADAHDLLAAGDLGAALQALQQQVRSRANDPKLRIFLFQLLAVRGEWQRALEQLTLCGELDPGTLAMVNTYGPALQCEAVRAAVFEGRTAPHVFGPPAQWMALLVQALRAESSGAHAQAADGRAQAFEQAPASSGRVDGQAFAWIADADTRLGPVLEVVIDGRYGWLPFAQLRALAIEPVADLRDLVWAPAHLTLANGGETVALIPARYAGTPAAGDDALMLARRTEWVEAGAGQFHGRGQRMLATDAAEFGLLDLRSVSFDAG